MERNSLSAFHARIALVTSIVFSPLFVPIITAIFVIGKLANTSQEVFLWLTIVATFVTILPTLAIVLLYRFSKVSNIHLHTKEERLIPLCLTFLSMFVGIIILYLIGANEKVIWVCQAYLINTVIFTIITPFWKISFHTSVATGCIIVLSLIVNKYLLLLFLFIPLIAWARIYRKRHTVLQAVFGTLVALANTLLYYHFLPPVN